MFWEATGEKFESNAKQFGFNKLYSFCWDLKPSFEMKILRIVLRAFYNKLF
jgi:hypothetical protein